MNKNLVLGTTRMNNKNLVVLGTTRMNNKNLVVLGTTRMKPEKVRLIRQENFKILKEV